MTLTQNWTAQQGLNFDRIVVPKDRRTRHILKATAAAGAVKTDSYGGLLPFTVTIMSEGSLWIHLDAIDLRDLAPGDYSYDVVATIPMNPPYNDYQSRKVVGGTITVQAYSTITYGDEDVRTMEMRWAKGEDFVRPLAWDDSLGVLQTINNAYLEATDPVSGATVLDLRYFTTVPSGATITAMPGAQKGYILQGALSGQTACTVTVVVDRMNTIPAGTYPFNLFVQDSLSRWDRLVKGSIYVSPAIGTAPY